MTQKDKELLLQDLCGRLPYGIKVKTNNINILKLGTHTRVGEYVTDVIEPCKPYLFPLSSMTEEQKYICPIGVGNLETFIEKESWAYLELSFDSILRFIDWLNKNHFDYRGLIEKGLAIDCTNLNTY